MSDTPVRAVAKMNAQGRIVIPAEMRRALGFEPGDELVLTIRDGALECQTQETLVRRYLAETSSDLRDMDVQGELKRLRREESASFDHEYPEPKTNRPKRKTA